MFQFLIGSLESYRSADAYVLVSMFQFLIGSLESYRAREP